jgi:hypothetical protein
MWRELIHGVAPDCVFAEPASAVRLGEAERSLSLGFPAELRSLLLETDGVLGKNELGLIWPLARIEADNLSFRSNSDFAELYMPFDPLLFFADAGNGDQFAFSVLQGAVSRSDIFAWDHEDDSRFWVAPSLEKYLEWWLVGKIQI